MITDVTELSGEDREIVADVAVVGAGPAGIVTALELAEGGHDVLVIETGGLKFNQEAQDLAEAADWDRARHAPLTMACRRQLGGSTVIWGGRCVPYDPIDFERRAIANFAEWPVTYEEISRYFGRACEWLVCGRPLFSAAQISGLSPGIVPGMVDGEIEGSHLERWSRPTNFGSQYRSRLISSPRARVVTGLTCTGIVAQGQGDRVDFLECRTLRGALVVVRAELYVVSAGGLESTRLLLAAARPDGEPVFDPDGPLGRYYMGHVEGVVADVQFLTPAKDTVFGYERDVDGSFVR
ncbi:MAG TPA: FAD-dependent oxidoreductase, partial [Acidimicrobiales bacterium]|nr:FAD-dependent oxidoreductase [Acidimicrobiales bacterium]